MRSSILALEIAANKAFDNSYRWNHWYWNFDQLRSVIHRRQLKPNMNAELCLIL